MGAEPSGFSELLRPYFAGRRVVLVGGHVTSLVPMARQVRTILGSEKPLILGIGVGTGELPTAREADWFSLDVVADDSVTAIHEYERQLVDLPDAARVALETYDPEGSALVVGSVVLGEVRHIGGRERFGARRPEWIALEDKVVVDGFWDRAGVTRAQSLVVPAEHAACAQAAAIVDRGAGTVWAGDAREGPHGGGVFTRWVRTAGDMEDAMAVLGPRCDRVRIMPFLEGMPCSVHGIVFPGGESVFRPVELITLQRPDRGNMLYAGASTYLRLDGEQEQAIREVGYRTARQLRDEVGYGGPFTVDGVLTADGFLPTELNPRTGFGHLLMEASEPDLPLNIIGLSAQYDSCPITCTAALETLVARLVDARPLASIRAIVPGVTVDTTVTRDVTRRGGELSFASPGDEVVGRLSFGPSCGGAFLLFEPAAGTVALGDRVAPLAVEAFALADTEFGTNLGVLDSPESELAH